MEFGNEVIVPHFVDLSVEKCYLKLEREVVGNVWISSGNVFLLQLIKQSPSNPISPGHLE